MTEQELIRKLAENFIEFSDADGNVAKQMNLVRYAKTLIMAHPNSKLIMERLENAEKRSRGLTGPLGNKEQAIEFVINQLSG